MKTSERTAFVIALGIIMVVSNGASAQSTLDTGRTIAPIVSTDWLTKNREMEGLVVLDVRSADDYAAGHIPGAISAPFVIPLSIWITMRDDLLLEVPDTDALFEAIGGLGIDTTSKVVVISAPNPGEPPHYGLSAATRVAVTLIYAGLTDVAILDGGHPKWQSEERPLSVELTTASPVLFDGVINTDMFVSIEHVHANLWFADVIDGRDPDVFYGATLGIFGGQYGHIWGAESLPAPWLWDYVEGNVYTFKDAELLGDMASGVIHRRFCPRHWPGCREAIVYCGVGGYASSLWYILTQVLGFTNVKFFDGSAQEWTRSYDMVPYRW